MSLRSSNNIKIEGGMSAMTDLVFLLLIFFVILSTLAKNATDVDLPQGGVPNSEQIQAVKVVIYADGKITINDKVSSLEDAEMMILSEIKKDKVIELYGDLKADYGSVYQIIEVAKRNQIKVALMSEN